MNPDKNVEKYRIYLSKSVYYVPLEKYNEFIKDFNDSNYAVIYCEGFIKIENKNQYVSIPQINIKFFENKKFIDWRKFKSETNNNAVSTLSEIKGIFDSSEVISEYLKVHNSTYSPVIGFEVADEEEWKNKIRKAK